MPVTVLNTFTWNDSSYRSSESNLAHRRVNVAVALEGVPDTDKAMEEAKQAAKSEVGDTLTYDGQTLPFINADANALGDGKALAVLHYGFNGDTEPIGDAFEMASRRTFDSHAFMRYQIITAFDDRTFDFSDAPTDTYFRLHDDFEEVDGDKNVLYRRMRERPEWFPVTQISVRTLLDEDPAQYADVAERYETINSDAVVINGQTYPPKSLMFKGVQERRIMSSEGIRDSYQYVFQHVQGGEWTTHRLVGPFFGAYDEQEDVFYASWMPEAQGLPVGFWWRVVVESGRFRGRHFQNFEEKEFANKFPIHDEPNAHGPAAASS